MTEELRLEDLDAYVPAKFSAASAAAWDSRAGMTVDVRMSAMARFGINVLALPVMRMVKPAPWSGDSMEYELNPGPSPAFV